MPNSIKEAAHILGMSNNPYNLEVKNQGMTAPDAIKSSKKRFNEINRTNLNYASISEFDSTDITNMWPGDYQGFHTGWERHAFSTHVVKDKDEDGKTHFIYVNRGERSDSDPNNNQEIAVMVFSVPQDEVEEFSNKFKKAFTTGKRTEINKFLHDEKNKNKRNVGLEHVKMKINIITALSSVSLN